MRWTKAYRKTHGKEMVVDSTFDFEKKRNEPIKYNRDLVVQTVQAIKKVSEVKARREREFWKNRMRKTKATEVDMIQRELERHIDLVSEPKTKQEIKTISLRKEIAQQEEQALKQEMRSKKKKIDVEQIGMDVE